MNDTGGQLVCAVAGALSLLSLLGCERDRRSAGLPVAAATAAAAARLAGTAADAADGAPAPAVCEGSGVTLPERGSPNRLAVVEVVRAHLAIKQELKVDRVVVAGDWAYLEGVELIENGRRVAALLRRQRGAWTALDVLTAPATDDVLRLRERLRADPRKPPPPLFGGD